MILVGPPGVGKGTQARILARHNGINHISSGQMFRSMVHKGGPLAEQIQAFIGKGHLVPDDMTTRVVEAYLDEKRLWDNYLLDGFPRTLPQAKLLDEKLAERRIALDAVIALELNDELVKHRLSGRWTCTKCGDVYHVETNPSKQAERCDACGATLEIRQDDKPEYVLERIKVYHRDTEPLLNYYRAAGLLKSADASKQITALAADVQKLVDDIRAASPGA